MKVGTDSVILGAWTSILDNPKTVLDIGAGTGILSLMIAQRCGAEIIDAIELEEGAYEQCVENFENSPWSDRLFCYHASLAEFTAEIEDKYDLIICNPPYFQTISIDDQNNARSKARNLEYLPLEELYWSVSKLLSASGLFSIIIPIELLDKAEKLATHYNLHLSRILYIQGNETSKIKRICLEHTFNTQPLNKENLIIEIERHQYTNAYKDLTKDFYLKM